MPIKSDPQNGGTHADGSKNIIYCSYCYQKGVFYLKERLKKCKHFVKIK
ncbi:zinc ribbon domain-containing protein [Flavivirga spongiicola]